MNRKQCVIFLVHDIVFILIINVPSDQVIYLDSRTYTAFHRNPVTHTYTLIHTDNNNKDNNHENKKVNQHLEKYTMILLQDNNNVP